MAMKTPRKEPAPPPNVAPDPAVIFLAAPPDDRLDRLIDVVRTLWTDPYARPHCRKSGGLPRAGCDCPVCAADVTLKGLATPPG